LPRASVVVMDGRIVGARESHQTKGQNRAKDSPNRQWSGSTSYGHRSSSTVYEIDFHIL
jgi:hypothetical protein